MSTPTPTDPTVTPARPGEAASFPSVVLEVLREEHARGTTVVVATHDPALLALSTATYAMEAGRLRAGGVAGA